MIMETSKLLGHQQPTFVGITFGITKGMFVTRDRSCWDVLQSVVALPVLIFIWQRLYYEAV